MNRTAGEVEVWTLNPCEAWNPHDPFLATGRGEPVGWVGTQVGPCAPSLSSTDKSRGGCGKALTTPLSLLLNLSLLG